MSFARRLVILLVVVSAVWLYSAGQAHAASITVGGGCSLNNAIDSVNNGANTGGCTQKVLTLLCC